MVNYNFQLFKVIKPPFVSFFKAFDNGRDIEPNPSSSNGREYSTTEKIKQLVSIIIIVNVTLKYVHKE